jgi:hypothetical protein
MVRIVVGSIVGVVVAIAIVMALETGSHTLWPPPPGLDLTGSQDMKALGAAMPLPALIAVPVAWFLSVLVGGSIGNLIAGRSVPGWIVAGVTLAACAYTLFSIPHPWWMIAAGVLLPPLGGWLAAKAVRPA